MYKSILFSVVLTAMLPQVRVVDANLATVCLESALYGIFLLLFLTSTGLAVNRYQYTTKHARDRQSIKSPFLNPMFIASIALSFTVTAVSTPCHLARNSEKASSTGFSPPIVYFWRMSISAMERPRLPFTPTKRKQQR